MDAEGELDDPGDSICFAQAPLILERLGIAARLLHATKEVRFADDAEVGRRHWPGVRLERSTKSFAMSSVLAFVSPKKFCVWPRRPNNVNRSVAKHCRRISSDVGPSRMANNAPRPITHKTDNPHDHDFDGARPAPC
jgi:hypothetical protein